MGYDAETASDSNRKNYGRKTEIMTIYKENMKILKNILHSITNQITDKNICYNPDRKKQLLRWGFI